MSHKDYYNRSLLHFAVIGEYYDIAEFLLEKGINYDEADCVSRTPLYYAKGKIKDLISSYGATIEMFNNHFLIEGIKNITFCDNHKIEKIYADLLEKKIICKKEILKKNNQIIGERLIKIPVEEQYKIWTPVYHGTKFLSIEHILIYGLTTFGEPLFGHIPLGEKINDIDNWAAAIFVSPSIFYASQYSEIIKTDDEEWYIIIEALVKPGAFTAHNSTLSNYKYRNGEPKNIEYRIGSEKIIGTYHYSLDKDKIQTISLLFIKKNYLDNFNNYNEFSI